MGTIRELWDVSWPPGFQLVVWISQLLRFFIEDSFCGLKVCEAAYRAIRADGHPGWPYDVSHVLDMFDHRAQAILFRVEEKGHSEDSDDGRIMAGYCAKNCICSPPGVIVDPTS